MTDPISDLLTRIRNAARARHHTVKIPASRIKADLLKIFREQGMIENFVLEDGAPTAQLKIFLKYGQNRESAIHDIQRVSSPGGRRYTGYKDLKPYLSGVGFRVLSTPMGLMTDKQAREQKVGGEVLCELW